jgi:DNA-binding response OmpR family regulator
MDILIIEDDPMIIETIRVGWPIPSDKLRFIATYRQSLHLIHSAEINSFDGVIVDIHLPDGDGLTILRAVRANTDIPLLLISGSGTGNSRADALDLGADDYIMKPFHIRELQARVARLVSIKKSKQKAASQRDRFMFGNIVCDLQKRLLCHAAVEIALTDMEVRILETLYQNRNSSCTKSFVYRNAFFRDYDPRDKSLDVYVSRLRKKAGQLDRRSAECLQTVRGSGYRYSELRHSPDR